MGRTACTEPQCPYKRALIKTEHKPRDKWRRMKGYRERYERKERKYKISTVNDRMIKNDEWQMCEKRWLCGYLTSLSQLTVTRPEESYRLWCVVVYHLETSGMGRPWPTGGLLRQKEKPQVTEIIQQKNRTKNGCKTRLVMAAETKFNLFTAIRIHTQENHEETGRN